MSLRSDELAQLGEVEHAVEAPARLAWAQAEHRRVEDHVVARGQVRVEADAELDERRDAAIYVDRAAVHGVDPREALQQRRLAGAVAADDAKELSRRDRERDVVECVEDVDGASTQRVKRPLLERAHLFPRDLEALVDPIDHDRGQQIVAHMPQEG